MTEVRASHILVKTEQEAKDLYEEITSGKITFADAAMEKSLCPSARDGGDLGYFGKGMMVKPFEDACFSIRRLSLYSSRITCSPHHFSDT